MSTYKNFILQYWPLAVEVGSRTGLHPYALFAIAGKESSGGVSYAARTRNNFFGLGGGKMKFSSPAGCIEYFGSLMARKYAAGIQVSGNPPAFASWFIDRSPYVGSDATPAQRAQYKKDIPVLWHTAERIARQAGLSLVSPALLAQSSPASPRPKNG
jgi:Mannosyl-glycoprotein endo-beta-N-acetylglucosaminidase